MGAGGSGWSTPAREYENTLSKEYDKLTYNFEELASHPGAVDMRSPGVLAGITERFYNITSMLEFWREKNRRRRPL